MNPRVESQRLRDELLRVLSEDRKNAEALISRLDSIVEERGIGAHASLLLILTRLIFEDDEARRHWEAILLHRKRMSESLRREVGVRVCALDYFLNANRQRVQPLLVDLEIRESEGRPGSPDLLTGLTADRGFRLAVQNETRRALRFGRKASVVLFDLDRFAEVNRAVGRLVADRMLKEAAVLLRNKVRAVDIVARPGEDELAILLPETDRTGAFLIAERFRREVEGHFSRREPAASKGGVTVSGGVACYPDDATSSDDLLERAAQALYRAKASGRNAIHVYHPERRRFLRVDLEAGRCELEVLGPREVGTATARNISRNGILFASPEPVSVGEEIEIRLVAGSDDAEPPRLRLRGRVVRLEELPAAAQDADGGAAAQPPADRFEIGMAFDLNFTQGEDDLVAFLEKTRREPGSATR